METEKLQQEINFYNNKAQENYDFAMKTENLALRYKHFNIGKYCANVALNLSRLSNAIKEKNNVRHGH